ncbi:ester cyclase [Haliangium sp.]|uniref:ester cyclase n=1 Tax=Haliangium sp. TaxID=2663208 RepID=UPI003D102B44
MMQSVREQKTRDQAIVRALYDQVWTRGDLDAVERLVAPRYRVHSDPGDAWEGQDLDHPTYRDRVAYSRTAFPDLVFTVHDTIGSEGLVAVRWSASGTQLGALQQLPATGERLGFAGQTIYQVEGGCVAGHWQVTDRLGFLQQLPGPVLAGLLAGERGRGDDPEGNGPRGGDRVDSAA